MAGASSENNRTCLRYSEPLASLKLSKYIIHTIPQITTQIIVLCIGTDRSTGDSLGPLTGTLFTKMRPNYIHSIGTLHEPVHAMNLETTLSHIQKTFHSPFIIAVDASLGKNSSVGNLICGKGPLQPGAAFNKNLPEVGDIHITGIVNMKGFYDFSVLQCTRLSFIYDMAEVLAQTLYYVELHLKTKKQEETS